MSCKLNKTKKKTSNRSRKKSTLFMEQDWQICECAQFYIRINGIAASVEQRQNKNIVCVVCVRKRMIWSIFCFLNFLQINLVFSIFCIRLLSPLLLSSFYYSFSLCSCLFKSFFFFFCQNVSSNFEIKIAFSLKKFQIHLNFKWIYRKKIHLNTLVHRECFEIWILFWLMPNFNLLYVSFYTREGNTAAPFPIQIYSYVKSFCTILTSDFNLRTVTFANNVSKQIFAPNNAFKKNWNTSRRHRAYVCETDLWNIKSNRLLLLLVFHKLVKHTIMLCAILMRFKFQCVN